MVLETNTRSSTRPNIHSLQHLGFNRWRGCSSSHRDTVLVRALMYVGTFENRSGDGASSHLWTGT